VWEGYALPHHSRRIDLAGDDLTWLLAAQLRAQGYPLSTRADYDALTALKERTPLCYVARDYESELSKFSQLSAAKRAAASFEMPDGERLFVAEPRFTAPEAMFRYSLLSDKPRPILGGPRTMMHTPPAYSGLTDAVLDVIRTTDANARAEYFGSVVLGGGNTLVQGFDERLQRELSAAVATEATSPVTVRTLSFPGRKYAAWVGGSILASMSTLPCQWTSKAEYEDYGASIVHRK
jgi:actin-related protein